MAENQVLDFPFGRRTLKATVARNEQEVTAWVGTLDQRRLKRYQEEGRLKIGVAGYWRKRRDKRAHTLAVCWGSNVCVMDVERVKVPVDLKRLLEKAEVSCFHWKVLKAKIKFLGVNFKGVVEIKQTLKEVWPAAPVGTEPRRAVKPKEGGELTQGGIIYAAAESFIAFEEAITNN